ncbi:MAG: LodA/GoxA family CTQ-dependent oxidase [Sneathiella sp.]
MAITLRIHPAIGVSRVGNSSEFILAPETSAGMPETGSDISGGLPIVPGTEAQTITDKDLRDAQGALKPHAQRFRIYAYDTPPDGSYPYKGSVSEICIGSQVDGKKVSGITWMVHMANKKCNSWIIPEDPDDAVKTNPDANFGVGGMAHYFNGATPNVRNGNFGKDADPTEGGGNGLPPGNVDLSDPLRLRRLVLDAGPKVIDSAAGAGKRVLFDKLSACRYIGTDGSVNIIDYPIQFPDTYFSELYQPAGPNLDSMGGMETDSQGRLLVIGSPGYGAGWKQTENNPFGSVPAGTPDEPFPLNSDIDNNGWFDDAGDGPVTASLQFTDGTTRVISVPAWCICADPAYAPQVRNVVSIWDEVYNSWLRAPELVLDTNIYTPTSSVDGTYNAGYTAAFEQDVWTMFRASHLQMFTTDLNAKALGSHDRLNHVSASDDPATYLNVKNFIRDPNTAPGNQLETGAPLMPLSLGDTGSSFLTVTHTQYFFLNQWYAGKYDDAKESLTAGELLDKNTLTNLLGGRFSPGIDLTFIVRDPYLYNQNWKAADVGPFRIGGKTLNYSTANIGIPFLGVGYTPNRTEENPVEPGDLCKFMALPWHTDYNSCATHQPAPNPDRNTTLFWSWPSQRPVSVYTFEDYVANKNAFFGDQHFSVRGTGTQWQTGDENEGDNGPSNVGRYQDRIDILKNWFNIGTVIQGPAIEGFTGDNTGLFLEVKSLLTGPSDWSQPWPILTTDKVYPDEVKPE